MIVLEYKIKGKQPQYNAIDDAIRTTQFVRNKAIRYWMDAPRELKIDKFALNKYSTEQRIEFPFTAELNSMAVQSAAERAWSAISRFYDNCKSNKSGKKGFPQFQKDCRSVEYKTSGWVRFVLSKWKLSKDERQFQIVDYKTTEIDNLIIM